ncbi:Dehydrogenase/reductase SDR family member 4 [Holothuria leucospilota]|uniref:Dehydrogenase/reductase SDR family member 4 n=1 Tax=Holothuria leucospilota TaxID=206669 RepID=A0A9Q1H9D3_HOLLE|nr:Dehydrogenase/reductase SDR family member 4 [Holothuria leucospilota]
MDISRFAGKVAICTASTTGIGYAAAERIAREGAKVVICSRRQEKVDAAVKKLRDQDLEVSGIVCHQARKMDRQKLIEFTLTTYGGVDLLFVSAGVNPSRGPMLSMTEKQWDKLFDVNVKSTFMIIQECVPYMIQRGRGAIVINSTVLALFPEAVNDFLQQIFPNETEIPPAKTFFQRYGNPAECGAVVAFLLSEDASFMTGEIISVGGGAEYFPIPKM